MGLCIEFFLAQLNHPVHPVILSNNASPNLRKTGRESRSNLGCNGGSEGAVRLRRTRGLAPANEVGNCRRTQGLAAQEIAASLGDSLLAMTRVQRLPSACGGLGDSLLLRKSTVNRSRKTGTVPSRSGTRSLGTVPVLLRFRW